MRCPVIRGQNISPADMSRHQKIPARSNVTTPAAGGSPDRVSQLQALEAASALRASPDKRLAQQLFSAPGRMRAKM